VGKTSLAAATALLAAEQGHRVLLVSTDLAHSLSDALDRPLASTPTEVATRLEAVEVDPRDEMEHHWGEVREHLLKVFSRQGVDGLVAEEMAVFPGMDDLLTLLLIRDQARAGEHDLIVVDCAPTGATLRLLSLPDVINWYMRKLFHVERAAVRAIKPVADRLLPAPLPGDEVYGALERLYQRLDGIKDVLCDPDVTSVRLVTNAERMAIEETRRAYSQIALHGLSVGAVLVNRVWPEHLADPFMQGILDVQAKYMAKIRECFDPVPILCAPMQSQEVVGEDGLLALARAMYGDRSAVAWFGSSNPVQFHSEPGGYRLELGLRFGDRGKMRVTQRGEELCIDIGGVRRNVLLPRAVSKLKVARASLEDGKLIITFGGVEQ
jgi:arsenite-transporting ATPase